MSHPCLAFQPSDKHVPGNVDYLITDQRGCIYSSVVECIAKGIEDNIITGTKVNSIRWNDECVCANVVTTGQEGIICGKYGLVTFSIGFTRMY